jgi:hypothetical protein
MPERFDGLLWHLLIDPPVNLMRLTTFVSTFEQDLVLRHEYDAHHTATSNTPEGLSRIVSLARV